MKKELDYFKVENLYGGSQDWFKDLLMKFGGCAAIAACESCMYFDLHHGTGLYPYEKNGFHKKDYLDFGKIMKPYLHPRLFGISRLELYIEGFGRYLQDCDEQRVRMKPLHGDREGTEARSALKMQIDQNLPVPCLLLKHRDPEFKDYVWHWFLLTGYEESKDRFMAKAVTYGNWKWLNFDRLWDTGYERKGGLILYQMQ